jgi:hypothetical protein
VYERGKCITSTEVNGDERGGAELQVSSFESGVGLSPLDSSLLDNAAYRHAGPHLVIQKSSREVWQARPLNVRIHNDNGACDKTKKARAQRLGRGE